MLGNAYLYFSTFHMPLLRLDCGNSPLGLRTIEAVRRISLGFVLQIKMGALRKLEALQHASICCWDILPCSLLAIFRFCSDKHPIVLP